MVDLASLPHLAGLDLRSALVLVLLEQQRPMSVAELVRALRRRGLQPPPDPGKAVSDALRWEVRRGRVRRVRRGVYAPGLVAKSTKHRMEGRVAATRNRTTRAADAAFRSDTEPMG